VGCRDKDCIPFYSPCCHGAPGRHFPCKYLASPPPVYASTGAAPFCKRRPEVKVLPMKVPDDYPDLSPNPRSRHFHKTVDQFRAVPRRP
jgi:hypothetical protein